MRSDDTLEQPPGAALVRIAAIGGEWLDRVPIVPRGRTLTVTVGRSEHRDVSAPTLAERGYRIVGGVGDGAPHVDVLVEIALAQAEPAWFRSLLAVADRAFDLRLGPVQALLGPTLAVHARH